MRLLYITTIGRTMGFFETLIRELLDAGHIVDIATNESSGKDPVPACYREWGCRVFPLPCSRSPMDKGNLVAIREIKAIVRNGNYDIVHCHTPIAAACTRIACKGLRKNGVKVFYTAHGFHFYSGAPLKNWLLYYPVEWLCAHWTDTLITINKEDYELAQKHMHAKRVEYVPGVGIDTKRFKETTVDRAAKRREIGVPEDAILLMSVGELNENKNHSVVIKALARLNDKNVHYAIAGTGPLKESLESLAASLGVGEQLHLLGYRRDVAELYKAADVYLHPSKREGLPVAVMEAMACGVPIIAANNRGTRDLLKNSKNILISSFEDVAGIADAIASLISNETMRVDIGQDNSKRSMKYDIIRVSQKIKKIYSFAIYSEKENTNIKDRLTKQ